jgi:quercetin dioxygenase-like cupin family protein
VKTLHSVADEIGRVLSVLGPTVELLTAPSDAAAVYCVMRGTIPPGVAVPLHSHPGDPETFFVVSGRGQALVEHDGRLEWQNVAAGDSVHIPAGVRHAHRNTSNEPLVELVVSTPALGRFFLEVGRELKPGSRPAPPRPDDLRRFQQVAAKYHHWLATPAENAAVGIVLP